ncbi:hypothetical protein TVAG_070760 [Trichomonas vaginalis G3]|uniref:Uncharacterized protein n=1 Tax=Trichomonas vaginalis (strain ATCC PRA-98 / G3) TaxID=412133 RepID=A2D7Y0_TRIV3|nr:PAS domain domain-containing protein [Trichomonas vaginalis G3]EAY23413.1 hypothetical protein TVAG_070760 [Trichomonas vaginalis G3]KAI5493826.1 PAS domain domain-containing protein [Trichomonas vaginalis G3]|eukprot:XP_001584399.1 hypothetical protein [Trichomonas vaginalis G3]
MMDALLTDSYDYTAKKVTTSQNTLIIICVVCYLLMFIIYFGFSNPVRHELISAVASVKLPLKFIDPIDLSDQAKLMQYLQGECDYGSSKFTDQQTGAPSGATFLNAMTVPFAVFESDLSLLFANNAFYSLLSTSREATVGLPLDEIFSHVLPFKENEDHPFNALLEAIQQLSRGVAAQNFCEIVTAMEVRERSNTPVMIRLIGVCDEKKGAVHDEDKDFIEGKNIKATQYIVHIMNLTKKKELEDKLKNESDLTQKLLEYAVTKQVIRSLTEQDQMVAKIYEKKPLLAFNVKAASEDEGSDEILYGCQLFLRTFKDIVTSFSSIAYLCNDAPTWYFIGGLGQNENDVKIGEEELIQFALSILEVFGQSISNNAATLSAIIHFGDFGVIPLKMDFPRVELSVKDFLRVSNLSDKGFRGKLFLTEEALEEAKGVKGLVSHKNPEQICGENVYIVDKLNEMSMNLDEFTIK